MVKVDIIFYILISPDSGLVLYARLTAESDSSEGQGADGSETAEELEFTGVAGEPCNCMMS